MLLDVDQIRIIHTLPGWWFNLPLTLRCLLDQLFVFEEQIIFPFVAVTARQSLLPFAEGTVGFPAVQFFF